MQKVLIFILCLAFAQADISRYVAVEKKYNFIQKSNKNWPLVLKNLSNGQTEIYLDDQNKNTLRKLFVVKNIVTNQQHHCEYKNAVYLILRGPKELELWRYPERGTPKQLFTAPQLDFRVSEKGDIVAVATARKLYFLNNSGQKLKIFTFNELTVGLSPQLNSPQLKNTSFALHVWSDDGLFWGVLVSAQPQFLISIDPKNWKITKYSLKALKVSEYALNPQTEKLLYSNHGLTKKKRPSLYVYNLKNGVQTEVVSTNVRAYNPHWIDEISFSFSNNSGKDLVFSLPSMH